MKKIMGILIIIFVCLAFFITQKIIYISHKSDPLMQEIIEKSDNYNVPAIEGTIINDYFILGKNGKEVNIDDSYIRMKKINQFDASLLMFDEVLPELNLFSYYDKFIVSGNLYERNVAITFKLDNENNITQLIDISNYLKTRNIKATFFIDGLIAKNNIEAITKIVNSKHYLANLGYNNFYDKKTIKETNSLIKRFIDNESYYCYLEEDNYKVLDICSSYKMHTIKPSIVVNNNLLVSLKEELNNGSIISISNKLGISDIEIIINYIKQKGYKFLTIEELIDN